MTQPDPQEQWHHAQYLDTHHVDPVRPDNVALCGVMLYNKLGATTREATTCPACLERLSETQRAHCMPRLLTDSPSYYRTDSGDLYARFIARYGLDTWLRHVEMEMQQYIDRAPHKGQYRTDIQKVLVICQRILAEIPAHELS